MKQKGLPTFDHDCATCPGFCCFALRIDKANHLDEVVHFENKPAMQPCRYLTRNFQCAIHDQLLEKGARTCSEYRCFSAGNFVAELCREYGIDYQPFLKRKIDESKSRLLGCFFCVSQDFFRILFLISCQSFHLQPTKIHSVYQNGQDIIRHNFPLLFSNFSAPNVYQFLHQSLSQILKANFPESSQIIDQSFQPLKLIPLKQL